MESENMEQDESILTLTDENGQDMDFEYLDCLTYEGKEYLVLMPASSAVRSETSVPLIVACSRKWVR